MEVEAYCEQADAGGCADSAEAVGVGAAGAGRAAAPAAGAALTQAAAGEAARALQPSERDQPGAGGLEVEPAEATDDLFDEWADDARRSGPAQAARGALRCAGTAAAAAGREDDDSEAGSEDSSDDDSSETPCPPQPAWAAPGVEVLVRAGAHVGRRGQLRSCGARGGWLKLYADDKGRGKSSKGRGRRDDAECFEEWLRLRPA